MTAADATLTLNVEIEGYKLRLLSRFLYLRMIGDLTGESLILKLLWKILQLEAITINAMINV